MSFLFLLLSILASYQLQADELAIMNDMDKVKHLIERGDSLKHKQYNLYWSKDLLSSDDIDYLSKDLNIAISAVPQILMRNDWIEKYKSKKLNVFIYESDNDVSHVLYGYESNYSEDAYIFLPYHIVRLRVAPVAHELTHLVLDKFGSLSLREGIASLVQYLIFPNQPFAFFGATTDMNSFARDLIKANRKMVKYAGSEGVTFFSSKQERREFYFISLSFVSFLVSEYGFEKFLELYEKAAYKKVLSIELEDLQSKWIEKSKSKITIDQISKIINDSDLSNIQFFFWPIVLVIPLVVFRKKLIIRNR